MLLSIACLCLWPNTVSGVGYARNLRSKLGSFEANMIAGVPPYLLIHKYHDYLELNEQLISDYLPMLRAAGVGDFRFLRDNPVFQEISMAPDAAEVHDASWHDRTLETSALYGNVVFSLPSAMYVGGIRVRYTAQEPDGTLPILAMSWRNDGQSDFAVGDSYGVAPHGDRANWERGSWLRIGQPETQLTIWPCAEIRYIRVTLNAKAVTHISELKLLIPR